MWSLAKQKAFPCWPGVLVVGLLVGCSNRPAVYPVSGRVVTASGKPVDSGLLEFRQLETKVNARARIQRDGTYRLTTFEEFDGAVAGKHQVILVQQIVAEVAPPPERVPDQNPEQAQTAQQHRRHEIVDRRFGSYETSPLEFTVEPIHQNTIDITVF